jgi:hypothetical protein
MRSNNHKINFLNPQKKEYTPAFLPIDWIIQTIFSPFVYIHQIFHAHALKKN